MRTGFTIALILPQGPLHRRRDRAYSRSLRYAPLTLAALAGLVPPELEAGVALFDEGVTVLELDAVAAELCGISIITGTAVRGYAIADALRARGCTVVIGGTHATLAPDEAAAHAHSVVTGAAETTWPRLLRDYARGALRPRYDQPADFRYGGFAAPRRELLDRAAYLTCNTVQAQRGCWNGCDFCAVAAASGRRLLQRPVPEVIAEIERLPGRHLVLLDPSPMEDAAYARALFRALRPLGRLWAGCASTRLADDPELMDLAAASGCRGLLVGFESVGQDVLRGVNKGFADAAGYRGFIRDLHARGIAVQGCFIFGHDADGPDVFARTVEFACATHIDVPEFSVYTPFPGTRAFARLEREGRIRERDWSLYDAEHVVFEPRGMSRAALFEGLCRAWHDAYTPATIARRLAGSRCLLPFSIPANVGYRRYAAALARLPDDAAREPARWDAAAH